MMTVRGVGATAIGVSLPTNREKLFGDALCSYARRLEAAGCFSLWVNDHLAAFPLGSDYYPYSPTGVPDWDASAPQYEALTACAFIAAVTRKVRIGTAVLVLPQRHPLEVAKAASTLADLSGGRFVLGVGGGWSVREMTALGWDPATRGPRLDEQIKILRSLWEPGRERPRLQHYNIPSDIICKPMPVPGTQPLILVGGMSRRAVRRVRELGDGWLAVASTDPDAVDDAGITLSALREERPELHGVLKVALPAYGRLMIRRTIEAAAEWGWDEVAFEADTWNIDDACDAVLALPPIDERMPA